MVMMMSNASHHRGGGRSSSLSSSSSSSPSSAFFPVLLVCCFLSAIIGFYAGAIWGMHAVVSYHHENSSLSSSSSSSSCSTETTKTDDGGGGCPPCHQQQQRQEGQRGQKSRQQTPPSSRRFPTATSSIASGLSLVDRNEFAAAFDTGVPLDRSNPRHNDQVLLIHTTRQALPSEAWEESQGADHPIPYLNVADATENCDYMHVILNQPDPKRAQCLAIMGQYEAFHIQKYMRLPLPEEQQQQGDGTSDAVDTVENLAADNADTKQKRNPPLSRQAPLRFVARGSQANGRISTKIPTQQDTLSYWTSSLLNYLRILPDKLDDVERIVVESMGHPRTVIVMVCNFGQAELLMNFVCSAKARAPPRPDESPLPLDQILVFATDIETRDLARDLGLHAYYDKDVFGEMPKQAARQYADKHFMKMMMAKVYCVQMTLLAGVRSGYHTNVLFQDVDVVWYRNPLEYFESPSAAGTGTTTATATTALTSSSQRDPRWPVHQPFDVYFQDDGNHALYYGPYSANTGFYYVRNNARTVYFFNSFLMAGDLITTSHSHQIALIALLNEHASMYGLRVKILARTDNEFPGGFHFHQRKPYMKTLLSKSNHRGDGASSSWLSSSRGRRGGGGSDNKMEPEEDVDPYMFHMSWTFNKNNKIKFLQQMGEWFLRDACVGKTVERITGKNTMRDDENADGEEEEQEQEEAQGDGPLMRLCCLAEPAITCHYRDKASRIPCRDSPPIDSGHPSFW